MSFKKAVLFVFALSGGLSTVAQEGTPGIAGVYNEGSIGLPMAVAPGSAVVMYMFGSAVGPAEPVVSAAYPLRTSLAGVSARVIVAGEAVDLWIVGVQARWIRAVLPSRTPV